MLINSKARNKVTNSFEEPLRLKPATMRSRQPWYSPARESEMAFQLKKTNTTPPAKAIHLINRAGESTKMGAA